MNARTGSLLRAALGLHCALHVTWVHASTPVADGYGPRGFAVQGSSREKIGVDAVGARFPVTQQEDRRMQTTYLFADGCELWECPVGYTNKIGDCVPPEAEEGRRLIGTSPTDDDWRSDDEYTVVDDDWVSTGDDEVTEIPVCTQAICCEVDEIPVSTPLALGCYKDVASDRIMEDRALVDSSMTTELCEVTCAGFSYFSTQYGRECWCGSAGSDYAKHGESTACTYECPGNSDETCGGFWAANVYAYDGENTPAPTVTARATSEFLGCFGDKYGDRIMDFALADGASMTQEMCEAECTGSAYFGLQYGRECWCGGQDMDVMKHGESTGCDYECPGNLGETCGGFFAMDVYEVFIES